ncbi:MAG: hypothetical protein AAGE94_25995 [Acidobacteriota bacterium]
MIEHEEDVEASGSRRALDGSRRSDQPVDVAITAALDGLRPLHSET